MLKRITSILLVLLLLFANYRFAYGLEIEITGNGSGTESQVNVAQDTQVEVEQSNEANIENDVQTQANTGGNETSLDTADTQIETGDITGEVEITNEVNTSEIEINNCCQEETIVKVVGNGADSQNVVGIEQIDSNKVGVFQSANVSNNIVGVSNTGNNTAKGNGGDVLISTGDVHVAAKVHNKNINGSSISVDRGVSSNIDIKVNNNAANTLNLVNIKERNEENLKVSNIASIVNNLNWYANTGENYANGNIGNVAITAGDIFLDFDIENGPINFSYIDVNDCCALDDPADPDDPSDPIDPGDGGWTYDDPDDPENSSGSSEVAAALISSVNDAAEVLGLSMTSSGIDSYQQMMFASFLIIIAGLRLIQNSDMVQSSKLEN